MLEEQKAGILEEITQEQAKKQSQEDELQALTKEWLHQKSSNKNRQGIDEQIKNIAITFIPYKTSVPCWNLR